MPAHRYGQAALLWFVTESFACLDVCAGMFFRKNDFLCSHLRLTRACAGSHRIASSYYPRVWLSIHYILLDDTHNNGGVTLHPRHAGRNYKFKVELSARMRSLLTQGRGRLSRPVETVQM